MPIYQRNGKTYNIPDSEVDGFEKTYPDATQRYVANGRNYNIPVSERSGFISAYKDATPFDKEPSETHKVKSDPSVSVDSQRMDSTRDYKPVIQEKPHTDFDLKKKMNGPTDSERREQERKRIEEQVRLTKDENEKDFRNAKENKAKADYEAVANSPFSFISEILFGTQTPKQIETQKKAELSRASLEKTNDAFNMIEEAKKKGNTTFASGFGRGFWDKISKVSTLDFGAMDSQTNLNILSASKKYEAGQSMTGEEEALLDAVALEAAANGEFSGDLGRGYKAGSTTAESLPFMAEFMINPATGTGKAVGKAAAKKIISNFGKEAAKSTIGKIARNSARVAGDVAGAGIMSGTTGAMRTTADAIERATGDVESIIDGDGYYRFGGNEEGDGALESFAKAYGASTIENFSEMFGNYLAPIGSAIGASAGKAMTKIGLGKVNKIIGDIKSSDIAKVIDDFQSKTQWNGTIGEYLEEQAGMAMNALTVGDNSLSDMIDPDTQIDTFLGVSAMGGLFSSVKTAGYAKEKYSARKKLNEADRFAADPNMIGEEWTEMKERIDQADDSELVSVLSETMANENISDKGKQAVLLYAGRLKAYHGASLADLKRKTEGDTPDEVVQSQMNFDEGYRLAEADRIEKRNALRQLDKIREKLDVEFLLDNNSERYDLMRQRADAGEDVTNELACINAQSRFDGMILGIRNAIDEKVSVSNQYITNLTHQDGNVYDVTLTADEKKHVFPISGSIVVDENGIIDRKQSDSRFIVRDDKGKIEMRSVDDLYKLESSDNAVALKEVTAQSIREQESARYAEEIETPSEEEKAEEVASVQPGDVISLDMQGIKTTAAVQSKRDGSTVLLFDEPIEYDGKKSQTIELSDEQVRAIIIPEDGNANVLVEDVAPNEDVIQDWQSNLLENEEVGAINEMETGPVEKATLGDIPVESTSVKSVPIQEEAMDLSAETEVLQENQATVIPIDKKGNKIYHKAPVEVSLQDMRAYGLDDVETDEFVNAQKVEAAKRIEKLEKSKPKVGTNLERYQADKKAWADNIADAQAQVGYWGEVEEQIRAIRVQPGDVAAEAIMQMGDPMNGEELASMMLGTGRLPILYDSYKKETGGRNAEARGMLGLFANKSNGGVTIEEAGEQLMLADLENGTNFFDQNDPNAGRNAIIEVLAGARTRGDLFNYIKNSREVMAERERAEEYNAYTQWYEDNFHMTPEDHTLYEDTLPTVLEEKAFTEDEYNEFMSTFVEQLNNEEYDTGRIRNEAQSNGQTGSDGIHEEGDPILQEEELVSSGRDGNIEERSEEVGNDVDNSDESVSGSASSGEVELSSRDSEDGIPSTLPLNEFLERRPVVPSYLYHGSPDGDLNMIDPFAHTQNWKEGIGFYTTESRDAAEMYANGRTARGERKSNAGKVNYIKPNPDARILDMDAELDAKLWEEIATNMDLYPPIDAKTNREAYIELIEMADDPEAQYAVEEALFANGYDASTHMEGKNGNPHRVTIWKNPDKLPQIIRPEDVYSESFSQIDEVDSNEATDILRQVQGESILDYAERVVKANEIAQEREAVNLNPTDAQKEAGNYKKGHVEIDGFNVTIENPKGGERSGVDANGQPWSVTMNNTYGYLRGTEGADGDHIDLFLSDDPTQGDVFVVDQVKEDGSFDEHKVMYGFTSIDEAKEAYLSNYSPGWEGLGNITGVSKEIFKEWVDSSRRKTKAFAEYEIVQESTYGPSKTDDSLRYRSSNENSDAEGRYDMALRAQGDFVSRYNSGEILVIENVDSVESQIRDAGITDARTLNALKEIASDGETSAIYSPYYDKILIFAENGNGDYESSLFHENVHRSINKIFGFDSHFISSLYDGLYKRLKKEFDIIREGYSLESEYNQKEECVAYYLEHLFEKRNLNKISGLIDSSNMGIVDQILNYIGYERKDEQGGGRGRSVLGISEREVGQLRNNEAPEINEKDSGGERSDVGGVRGEDYTGTKESTGDEGTTETGKEIITSVESLSKELNTPVRIVRDVNDLTDSDRDMLKRKRMSKGWFDPKTGEVVFVLPNAESVEDSVATILHEVVAHRGLRELFGKDFDGFLDNLYGGVSEEIRTRINRMAQKHGFDTRIATEEYLASLAEHGFEDVHEKSAWEKIKELFSDMLRRVGVKLSKPLNDEDLRYILWKSMNRLKDGDGIVDKAEKIAKDREVSDRLFRFREEATEEQENEDIARLEYENALDKTKNQMYRWQEAYQDSMLGLKKLQEAIEKESESKLQHFEDAYMAENQMSSKSAFETEVYKDKFLVPMLNAIKAITDKKVKRDEVNTYVMAKHGLERNEVFAKRDAEQSANDEFDEKISDVNRSLDNGNITHDEWEEKIDGLNAQKKAFYEEQYLKNRMRDYSGLTQLAEKENEEEEDYEVVAKGIVDQFEEAHGELCDKLWEKINLATNQTLKKSYESGLMNRSTYDKVRNMFEFYVPLRGWDDDIASDVYEYMLSERSVFQTPVKAAFGRKSLADDPFANIGNMAESGILQGNRNLMKQKFLNMVLNHPTSLATVKTMWYERIVHGDKEEWVESFPEIKEGATPDDITKAIEDHEAEMVELEKNRMATKSTNKIKLDYRASNREKDEHMVVVKNAGKEYVIYVNGNPRAAQAVNGLTNPDAMDNKIMQAVGKINRQLAANFTTRNPAFVLSNMSRDVIFSTSAVWVKEDWKYAKRFDKNIIKNIGAIAGLMARYKSGKLDMRNSRDRHFLEFLENGGETGYTALHNVEEYKKMMDRHVKKSNGAWGSVGSGVHAIVDAVSFMNRCAENVSRFTTYQTSREMGRGISESVRDAKEVTVNFNKKGAGGLGAGTFKSLFLFFNAAVQSLKNFKDLHGKSKSKFYTTIGGFAAAGILMPMINNAIIEMLAGDDDDDEMTDEERAELMKKRGAYDNLPEWVRKNNFCLWVGGERFVTIPLPIELRAFYGLGEMWYQMGRGNMNGVDGKVDVKKASFEMVNQLTELLPINPMGGNGDALSVIVPDAGKPLYQVFANRDFFGKPIYKEGDYNELLPAWTKAYNGTAKWMVNSAEFINEVSGGDKYKRGGVDLNPATIEHVFEGYLGGMGKTANQLFKTLSMIWDEDERMWRNVPVANRFISGSDNKIEFRKVNEAYYQCMDELKETEQRLRGYENEAEMGIEEYAEKYDFLNESKENERYQIMKEYKSVIDDLRKVIKESDQEEKKEIEMEVNLLKMEMLDELKNTK